MSYNATISLPLEINLKCPIKPTIQYLHLFVAHRNPPRKELLLQESGYDAMTTVNPTRGQGRNCNVFLANSGCEVVEKEGPDGFCCTS